MTRFLSGFIKNFDIILTIGGAGTVALLGFLSIVEPEIVSSAILTILTLIAISLLLNRKKDSYLHQKMDDIINRLLNPSAAQKFKPYKKYMDEIDQKISQAKEVWILSRTCGGYWKNYKDEFKKLLDNNSNNSCIKMMTVHPDNGAVKMITNYSEWENQDRPDSLKDSINAFIKDIKTKFPLELKSKRVEVALIDYLPAWSLVLIDPNSKENGIIYVELATFRAHPRNRPTFSLKSREDSHYFEKFKNEFLTMFSYAKKVNDFKPV